MDKLGGNKAGLPFFTFLNAKGDLIVSSKKDGRDNIGYPLDAGDIAWFMIMLNKAVPDMAKADRESIETWLRNQKK